jgi:acyl-CoA thioesterase
MTDGPGDAQNLAMRCAAAMWADDACARGLGMVIVEVAPGRAVLELGVDARMVNGHGIGHGGMTFTLADTAFAFASNSRDRRAVAQHATITFLRPVQLGDRLRAEAAEREKAGRSGVYDVTVTNAEGAVVAEFRGLSRETGGPVLEAGESDG